MFISVVSATSSSTVAISQFRISIKWWLNKISKTCKFLIVVGLSLLFNPFVCIVQMGKQSEENLALDPILMDLQRAANIKKIVKQKRVDSSQQLLSIAATSKEADPLLVVAGMKRPKKPSEEPVTRIAEDQNGKHRKSNETEVKLNGTKNEKVKTNGSTGWCTFSTV